MQLIIFLFQLLKPTEKVHLQHIVFAKHWPMQMLSRNMSFNGVQKRDRGTYGCGARQELDPFTFATSVSWVKVLVKDEVR